MKRLKKYLIFSVFAIYFIFGIGLFSAKALTTENGEFPNIPNDGFDNFVLVESAEGAFNLYTFNAETNLDFKFHPNISSLSIDKGSNAISTVDYRRYRLVDGKWQYWNQSGNYSFPCIKIVATTYLIHQLEGANWVPTYFPGYGLNSSLILKKEFSYINDFTNPVKSIDFYFSGEDLTKKINFEFNFKDNIDYNSCSWCSNYSEIINFSSSILIKDDDNFYKWINSNSFNGGFVDYSGDSLPKNENGQGYILKGNFIFNFQDYAIENIEMVRISINISMGYNFSYQYKDNSSITIDNIDEYYHYMLSSNGERLNRISSNKTKYTILSTNADKIKNDLIVEYINTNKYLYVEYFDTSTHSYIENGNILSYDYSKFSNRDFEKFTYEIGKTNSKGIYLMNYLYNRENKNLDSMYYFYIPCDVYYSYTDFLDESIFYDNTGNKNNSIVANPNYETDNKFFSDNFRPIYKFLDEMQETSDVFNKSFDKIYYSIPGIVRTFFVVVTHLLCMFIFMKIVGYE